MYLVHNNSSTKHSSTYMRTGSREAEMLHHCMSQMHAHRSRPQGVLRTQSSTTHGSLPTAAYSPHLDENIKKKLLNNELTWFRTPPRNRCALRICRRTGRHKIQCRIVVLLVEAGQSAARDFFGKTPPKQEPRDCPCLRPPNG